MSGNICRWGILGTAGIAHKNYQAILNAQNSTLVAVASRETKRAQAFIEECQHSAPFHPAPRAVGSYEELLHSPDIDALYIPLPTGLRQEWIIKAADAGKHVLAEKPCGINAQQVTEILEACARNNVQYMDGVMFMHSARLQSIRTTLDDGSSVGSIRRIASQFSFRGPDEFFQGNIRVKSELEPLGCLGDLGWYNLRFILWTLNYEMPERVGGRILAEQDGVPTEFSADLFFPNQVSAHFYCSFLTENQQWVNVSGTKGYLYLNDFVLPYFGPEAGYDVCNADYTMRGCNFNMEKHDRRVAVREYSNSHVNAQETKMIERLAELALGGRPDPSWGEISLKTQLLADACLQSARKGGNLITL